MSKSDKITRKRKKVPKTVSNCYYEEKPETLTGLDQIVDDYIHWHRELAEQHLQFFSERSSLEEAIEYAALAKRPDGKRHWHQRRIPKESLKESHRRLLHARKSLRASRTFSTLYDLVQEIIGPIPDIGELTVYDTTLAIGAYLKLTPENIYVHRGVRDGLKALGLYKGQQMIVPSELPKAFRRLRPYEIEDCLCIYKEDFNGTPT